VSLSWQLNLALSVFSQTFTKHTSDFLLGSTVYDNAEKTRQGYKFENILTYI